MQTFNAFLNNLYFLHCCQNKGVNNKIWKELLLIHHLINHSLPSAHKAPPHLIGPRQTAAGEAVADICVAHYSSFFRFS